MNGGWDESSAESKAGRVCVPVHERRLARRVSVVVGWYKVAQRN